MNHRTFFFYGCSNGMCTLWIIFFTTYWSGTEKKKMKLKFKYNHKCKYTVWFFFFVTFILCNRVWMDGVWERERERKNARVREKKKWHKLNGLQFDISIWIPIWWHFHWQLYVTIFLPFHLKVFQWLMHVYWIYHVGIMYFLLHSFLYLFLIWW